MENQVEVTDRILELKEVLPITDVKEAYFFIVRSIKEANKLPVNDPLRDAHKREVSRILSAFFSESRIDGVNWNLLVQYLAHLVLRLLEGEKSEPVQAGTFAHHLAQSSYAGWLFPASAWGNYQLAGTSQYTSRHIMKAIMISGRHTPSDSLRSYLQAVREGDVKLLSRDTALSNK